jgi:hypothetical protein
MKLFIVGLTNRCLTCGHGVYQEIQDDKARTPTLKCVNESCVEFNRTFVVPSIELKEYQVEEEAQPKAGGTV